MDSTLQYMQELLLQGDILKLKEELSHVTDWTKELCVLAVMTDVILNELFYIPNWQSNFRIIKISNSCFNWKN